MKIIDFGPGEQFDTEDQYEKHCVFLLTLYFGCSCKPLNESFMLEQPKYRVKTKKNKNDSSRIDLLTSY